MQYFCLDILFILPVPFRKRNWQFPWPCILRTGFVNHFDFCFSLSNSELSSSINLFFSRQRLHSKLNPAILAQTGFSCHFFSAFASEFLALLLSCCLLTSRFYSCFLAVFAYQFSFFTVAVLAFFTLSVICFN
jgi:hypothetical protein